MFVVGDAQESAWLRAASYISTNILSFHSCQTLWALWTISNYTLTYFTSSRSPSHCPSLSSLLLSPSLLTHTHNTPSISSPSLSSNSQEPGQRHCHFTLEAWGFCWPCFVGLHVASTNRASICLCCGKGYDHKGFSSIVFNPVLKCVVFPQKS